MRTINKTLTTQLVELGVGAGVGRIKDEKKSGVIIYIWGGVSDRKSVV